MDIRDVTLLLVRRPFAGGDGGEGNSERQRLRQMELGEG